MIVIYGASGHTGTLIARALYEQQLDFAMAGRCIERLQTSARAVECSDLRVAAIDDSKALLQAFEDADVVINCAGPFRTLGEPVVSAALAADAHYIDTSAEQDFVRKIYEHYESSARHAQRVIVNACAFEVALGDWAAHLAVKALDVAVVDDLKISYAIEHMRPTKGTQLSILETLGTVGCYWDEGRWIPVSAASERREVNYPLPFGTRTALSFPSPEVISVPRHAPTRRLQTYMSLGQDNALFRAANVVAPVIAPIVGPLLGSLMRSPLGAMAHSTIRAAHTPLSDVPARFAIVAEAMVQGRTARCSISGQDIYGVTASIACLAAERLQNEGELSGVLAPSELLDPKDALEEIAEQNCLLLELPQSEDA